VRRVSELTLRRAAAIREIGALGFSAEHAAMLLQIESARVSQIRAYFKIPMPDGRVGRPGWLQQRVLKDYGKEGMTPAVMAERYATSRNSVSVRISELRKQGKLPQINGSVANPQSLGLSYFRMSSAVNYQKW